MTETLALAVVIFFAFLAVVLFVAIPFIVFAGRLLDRLLS